MRFNEWLNGRNRGDEDIEFYEDTHDEQGNYIGRQTRQAATMRSSVVNSPSQTTGQMSQTYSAQNYAVQSSGGHGQPQGGAQAYGQPQGGAQVQAKVYGQASGKDTVTARSFGNIVVYRPKTPEEVETLINFLRRGEPSVANLNELSDIDAQRILDFLSGAIYALGGNIHRINDNIFLLSPSGVEIQSYSDKN